MNLMSDEDRYLVEAITKYLDDKGAKNSYKDFNELVNDFISMQNTEVAISKYERYFDNIYELMHIAMMLRRRRNGK
jgi:hypothetical protein